MCHDLYLFVNKACQVSLLLLYCDYCHCPVTEYLEYLRPVLVCGDLFSSFRRWFRTASESLDVWVSVWVMLGTLVPTVPVGTPVPIGTIDPSGTLIPADRSG